MIIDQIESALDASGLVDDYTLSHYRWYDDDPAEFKLIIRLAGGAPLDPLIGRPSYQLLLLSTNQNVTALHTKTEQIKSYLLRNYQFQDIINFEFPADIQGPFYIENDRVIYQLDINIIENRSDE